MVQNLFSSLLFLDESLFLSINHLPHTPLTNALGLLLSGVGTAGIIWFLLGLFLFFREEKKDRLFFVPLFLAGGFSWFMVEVVLKPLAARSRPGLELGAIIVGSSLNDSYSFPSGHATIAFAMAVVLSKKEPKWKWMFYMLAVLISLSRIFLGKHYPTDVLVGAFLGWGIGKLSLILPHFIKRYTKHNA